MIHILGKPIYKVGDIVSFDYVIDGKEVVLTGTVEIVDAYGCWQYSDEPCYDVMVENWLNTNQDCLVKHIRESQIEINT